MAEPATAPPAISILSPVFNEGLFIEECMRSVQAQSFGDFEHIIVNDHSGDDTLAKAQALADHRTQVLTNPRKGKVAAIQEAFARARAPLIVLLAGDDILPEDSLAIRAKALEGVDGSQDRIIARGHLRSFSDDKRFDGKILPKHKQGNLSGGGVILTRALGEDALMAPEELPNEDSWLRLCAEHLATEIRNSPGIVLYYRIHANNSSNTRVGFQKANDSMTRRAEVYRLFRDRYQGQLDQVALAKVAAQADLEDRRRSGNLIRILGTPGVPFLDRVRAASYSSAPLYKLRMALWGLTTGLR